LDFLNFLANFGFFVDVLEILDLECYFSDSQHRLKHPAKMPRYIGTSCCLSFRRLHKDYIDRGHMTQMVEGTYVANYETYCVGSEKTRT
jgi:hypothetical protein